MWLRTCSGRHVCRRRRGIASCHKACLPRASVACGWAGGSRWCAPSSTCTPSGSSTATSREPTCCSTNVSTGQCVTAAVLCKARPPRGPFGHGRGSRLRQRACSAPPEPFAAVPADSDLCPAVGQGCRGSAARAAQDRRLWHRIAAAGPFGVMSSCRDVIATVRRDVVLPVRHRVRGCSAFTRPRTARPSATRPHSPPRSARPVRTLAAALCVAPSACSCDACGARIAPSIILRLGMAGLGNVCSRRPVTAVAAGLQRGWLQRC